MKPFLLVLMSVATASSVWAAPATQTKNLAVPPSLATFAAGGVVTDITFIMPDQTTEYFRYQIKNGKLNVLEHTNQTFDVRDLSDHYELGTPLPAATKLKDDPSQLTELFQKGTPGMSISVKRGEGDKVKPLFYAWTKNNKWTQQSTVPAVFDTSEVNLDPDSPAYKAALAALKQLAQSNLATSKLTAAQLKKLQDQIFEKQAADFDAPDAVGIAAVGGAAVAGAAAGRAAAGRVKTQTVVAPPTVKVTAQPAQAPVNPLVKAQANKTTPSKAAQRQAAADDTGWDLTQNPQLLQQLSDAPAERTN